MTARRDKQQGSSFFRGHENTIASGLVSLAPDDTVGVAHWCDDGQTSIDLKPGHDANAAMQQVTANLTTTYQSSSRISNRGRQLGLEALITLVDYYTVESRSRSRPVFCFLHQGNIDIPVDTSKGPNGEATTRQINY